MSGAEMSRTGSPAASPGTRVGSGPAPARPAPVRAGWPLYEFALTAMLMFAVVTVIRWVLDPSSPFFLADFQQALLVVGALTGAMVCGLIRSPWGRLSGAHMNPAITFALWRLKFFPGRTVVVYVFAQLCGSLVGTVLARLAWGPAVARVGYGAVAAAPSWDGWAVFAAEGACLVPVTLMIGFFLARPGRERWFPWVLAVLVCAIIAVLGPLSGGAANPARQFGPALMSGTTAYLWIYLVAPGLGAALGAAAHHRITAPSYGYGR